MCAGTHAPLVWFTLTPPVSGFHSITALLSPCYLVVFTSGNLPLRFREILRRNENFIGVRHPEPRELEPIERRFPHLAQYVKEMIKVSGGELVHAYVHTHTHIRTNSHTLYGHTYSTYVYTPLHIYTYMYIQGRQNKGGRGGLSPSALQNRGA